MFRLLFSLSLLDDAACGASWKQRSKPCARLRKNRTGVPIDCFHL